MLPEADSSLRAPPIGFSSVTRTPENLSHFPSILNIWNLFPPVSHQAPGVSKELCKVSSLPLRPLQGGASQNSAFPLQGLAHGVLNRRIQTKNEFIWDLPACARESSSCITSACPCQILHTFSMSLPQSLGLITNPLSLATAAGWGNSARRISNMKFPLFDFGEL